MDNSFSSDTLQQNPQKLSADIREKNLSANATDRGVPILSMALANNNLGLAKELIGHGADVNGYARWPAAERGMAPIHFATTPEAVKLLADANANVNAPYLKVDHAWGMRGETALHTAALGKDQKSLELAQALIQAGAKTDIPYSNDEFKYGTSSTTPTIDRVVRSQLSIEKNLSLLSKAFAARENSIEPTFGPDIKVEKNPPPPSMKEVPKSVTHPSEVSKAVTYALDIPGTLYTDTKISKAGSLTPSHIQAFDHDLKQIASVPVASFKEREGPSVPEANTGGNVSDERTPKELAKTAPEKDRDGINELNERIAVQGAKELAQATLASVSAGYAEDYATKVNELEEARHMKSEAYKKLATVSPVRAEALVAEERDKYKHDGLVHDGIKFELAKYQAAFPQRSIEGKGEPDSAEQKPSITRIVPEDEKKPEALFLGDQAAKAVLDKTGYKLPENLLRTYNVQDGKFHDKDTNALRFEDHGKKLSTPIEDRQVIAHMIDVAAAKNWGHLELKGTETFKQTAWLEAQSRGIETKGYKPNDRDMEQLEKLRQERGTDEKQIAGTNAKSVREQNEIVATAPRSLSPAEKASLDVATKVMTRAMTKLPEHIRVDALNKMTTAVLKGELQLPVPKVMERAVDAPRPAPAPAMDRSR